MLQTENIILPVAVVALIEMKMMAANSRQSRTDAQPRTERRGREKKNTARR